MKLIILQLNAIISTACKNLELIQLHRMINEGVLLLDARFKEPLVIDIDSGQKHYGKSAPQRLRSVALSVIGKWIA